MARKKNPPIPKPTQPPYAVEHKEALNNVWAHLCDLTTDAPTNLHNYENLTPSDLIYIACSLTQASAVLIAVASTRMEPANG